MIYNILAHVISLFLAPVFAEIAAIPARFLGRLISGIASSFAVIWLSTVIFGWFSKEPGILFIVLLFFFTIQNDLSRIHSRGEQEVNY